MLHPVRYGSQSHSGDSESVDKFGFGINRDWRPEQIPRLPDRELEVLVPKSNGREALVRSHFLREEIEEKLSVALK